MGFSSWDLAKIEISVGGISTYGADVRGGGKSEDFGVLVFFGPKIEPFWVFLENDVFDFFRFWPEVRSSI